MSDKERNECSRCQELEAKLKRMHEYLDALNITIFAVDEDLKTTFVNKCSAEQWMNMSRDEMMGKDYEELAEPSGVDIEYLIASKELNRQVFLTGMPIINQLDRVAIDGRGRQRQMLTSRFPVFGADGRVEETICYAMDVTFSHAESESFKKYFSNIIVDPSTKQGALAKRMLSLSSNAHRDVEMRDEICFMLDRRDQVQIVL